MDHAKWLEQLEAMQTAVARLELAKDTSNGVTADWEDDNEAYSYFSRSSSIRSGQDVWDFISDSELDELGLGRGDDDYPDSGEGLDQGGRVQEWLPRKCAEIASSKGGLSREALHSQVIEILTDGRPEDDIQSSLTDLVGFDDMEFVIELLSRRAEIVASSSAVEQQEAQPSSTRLLTKAQRHAALERMDREHKAAKLAPARAKDADYPHIYRENHSGNILSHMGKKYALPVGSERKDHEKYEEYIVPAGKPGSLLPGQKLVKISDLDGVCRTTFKGYKTLNRMQSLVYPVAYRTSENLLICAPTGAGKTDAALLAVLHTICQYLTPDPLEEHGATEFAVQADEFKIVYVAPMKALAAEITEKLGRRLTWLGIRCREYTGDMHLTKAEVVQTQIIVTTPEKWDVVTRRGTGDTELVQKVRLLIIDEVHMLHDERGAVIESLVARTERQVESTQSLIRIVGLSATLPNYLDVARFLRVNKNGLFYFDASFRPVPLEQHFVGVKGAKAGSKQARDALDQVAYEKVRDMLEQDHQVMVFVHSRRDTLATAKMLLDKARDDGCLDLFDPSRHDRYKNAVRDGRHTKEREIRELIPQGLGIHHAGMARSDRNLMERLFGEGVTRVLCCTATLAWGVNLPAAAVVIKGTQVYSAQHGKFEDVGILDVLQIFGRAGRPQFEDVGIGIICTTADKLDHYLTAVTAQVPIESRFSAKLVDNLNAEVALGTVTSVSEAVQWIGYSYLFVRMLAFPRAYGIEWKEASDDPSLVQRRRKLVTDAARTLHQSQMLIFNERTEELRSKDIGRIASQFYISHETIQLFNRMMRPTATEADILAMLSRSSEFSNVQSRDSEANELTAMRESETVVPCAVAGGIDTQQAKTNILLQAYISRRPPQDFALTNDMNYVAQQAGRISRALVMMARNRRWGHQCLVMVTLAKSIERRVWPFEHPLAQFAQVGTRSNYFGLPRLVLDRLNRNGSYTMERLQDLQPAEIGELVSNHAAGVKIARMLRNFPTVRIESDMVPLNRDVLRMKLTITADFVWNDQVHGSSESYLVWVENSETSEMYHDEFFILNRRKMRDAHELSFSIPLSDPLPPQIYVRAVSDRWLGAETVTPVSFQHLIRPDTESVYTDLLNLQPLPVSALNNKTLEMLYRQRFAFFNPMQTHVFHTLYHTPQNVLLGSPTGSGKTVAAELAMWWARRERPGSKVVYIAPMKALVRERMRDWGVRLARPLGLRLVELTGDNTPDTRTIQDADIIITTPEKWDGVSRSWQTRDYVRRVGLVVIDEIHLLAGDRGPILEIIVSRMNYMAVATGGSVRLLGMSTACANATDLASWLGVPSNALFNFRHSVRPVPLELYIDGFPETRGFCPLMQSMNRPTFLAIKNHSPNKPVIVFVPSRRQTRLTAKDLIRFCGMEDNPRRFLYMSDEDLELHLTRVQDEALREALSFGIGLHHAGLVESDRQLAEELFLHNKTQILVATSTLAWGVNLPAHLVVVKGTQFYDAKTEAYKDMDLTDVLQMLGRAGRPQFDSSGVARIFTQSAKKDFYKHFLHTGFPVESSLHTAVLENHVGAEVSAGTIVSKQDALDYLTWTFFFRRLHKNPSYYGFDMSSQDDDDKNDDYSDSKNDGDKDNHHHLSPQQRANKFMIDMIDKSLAALAESGCVHVFPNGDVDPTALGRIMSYYYLSHHTVRQLVKRAKPRADFAHVLASMCRAAEYDELPVRHNEDLVNAELARSLPFTVGDLGLPTRDPHVKAFVLLQAHMARLPLPITDYVGDQTSVLDQAVRIVQASIDVMAELGHASTMFEFIRLLQAVKSARWPSDPPLSILPGLDDADDLGSVNKMTLQDLSAQMRVSQQQEQQQAPMAETVGRQLGVPPAQLSRFRRAATCIPDVEVVIADIKAHEVTVVLRRQNPITERGGRIFAPRFPKPQTEGWFVAVVDLARDNVVAVKRVGWSGSAVNVGTKPSSRTVMKLPPPSSSDVRTMDVVVMSDAYIGLEYKVLGILVPGLPAVAEAHADREMKGRLSE